MNAFPGFPKDTIDFLHDLEENNNRPWFSENKSRYEQSVVEPALQLISSLEKPLQRLAPLLDVKAKRVGGSLMRIYKDTRFSKDKTPYKTNIGIHFRHSAGKDVHAPGVYLHIATDECFLGAGMWRPDSQALKNIRGAIIEDETAWRKAISNKRFRETFEMADDRLKSAPRGVSKDHPLIEDLRLKSFIGTTKLKRAQVQSPALAKEITDGIRRAAPLMRFLCQALDQPY